MSGVRLNPDRVLGVTLPDGTTVKRKYILQQVNFLRKLRLYLRVTDGDESTNFKVTNLGNVVTFDPPRWVVDRQNRFHVLHRIDANSSAYHLFETNGQITRRELYRYTTTTPELRVNEAGEVAVIGGVRRPSPGDIPAPGTNRPPAKVTTADLKPEENAKPPTEPTPERKP